MPGWAHSAPLAGTKGTGTAPGRKRINTVNLIKGANNNKTIDKIRSSGL